jgi:hypothetical protein
MFAFGRLSPGDLKKQKSMIMDKARSGNDRLAVWGSFGSGAEMTVVGY